MKAARTRATVQATLALVALGFASIAASARAESTRPAPTEPTSAPDRPPGRDASSLVVYVDSDDDDQDGTRDLEELRLNPAQLMDLTWLPSAHAGPELLSRVLSGARAGRARAVDASGAIWNGTASRRPSRIGLQGLAPGALLDPAPGLPGISVIEFMAVDAHGARVDLARSHASLSRVLPDFLAGEALADEDALRWVAIGQADVLPERVELISWGVDGRRLDELPRVELWAMPCPANSPPDLACRGTPLIRAVVDRIDRNHPESAGRSLRAEVGGRIQVKSNEREVSGLRVGGPRSSALGEIGRLRAKLRVHLLRHAPGAAPALPGSDADAVSRARSEVQAASLLWGQCGIHFGPERDLAVELVSPPPPYLLSIGSALGLPASGGELRFKVGARRVRVQTRPHQSPLEVAFQTADELTRAGFNAEVSRNPRIEPGALESADVLVQKQAGAARGPGQARARWAQLEPDGVAPLSSDPSLNVQIGSVDFSDGLSHFDNYDALSGTLEERTLLKAFVDTDPSTIEVFIVPVFGSSGRVGESFLDTPEAALRNTVIVDRLAVLSSVQSHVLAHELGHVLMNMPGHPDDYGVDQPSSLMDGDATDPSIFGPRRLSVAECERALRERGPASRAPLLSPWPLYSAPSSSGTARPEQPALEPKAAGN